MSDIKVNIVGEFKKKGFDDAGKATNKLEKSFKRLGLQLAAAFSVRAVTQFTKASIRAFVDEDKAVRRLGFSLEALGQAYMLPQVEDYIANLQTTTAIADGELRPALQQLLTVTGDLAKSQELLNTALDVSAGTGKDLRSVATALGRAYSGNTTSLGRLNIGLTKADLASKSFEENLANINRKFTGSAVQAAGTYAGQMQSIANAAGDAQEIIGQGLVDAIAILGGQNGVEIIQGQMLKLAEDTADVARGLGVILERLNFKVQADAKSNTLASFLGYIPVLGAYLAPLVTKLGQMGDAVERANQPLFFPTSLANIETQKQIEKQRRLDEQRRKRAEALDKKLAADRLKREKQIAALKRASSVFDLEKIQIEAALKGKITDEERTRLLLMKAILNEDADTATKLADRLKDMQTETIKLANMLTTFPKANDPFTDWMESLNRITGALGGILSLTNAQTMAAQSYASAAAAALAAGDMYAAQGTALTSTAQAQEAVKAAQDALGAAKTPSEVMAAQSFLDAANGALEAANAIAESASALALGAAAAEMVASANLLGESIASTQQTGAYAPNVVVNVAGTVVSDRDLQEAVLEGLYEVQKRGQTITLSAVAL
jgi:hypothetical protein